MRQLALFYQIILVFLMASSTSAVAHPKCKIPLPFNGWTETCPHSHKSETIGSKSLPSQVPPKPAQSFFRVRIKNDCHEDIRYAIVYHTAGEWRHAAWFTIAPGETTGNLAKVSFTANKYYYFARSDSFVWRDTDGPSYTISGEPYYLREKQISGDFRDYQHGLSCNGN